MKFNQLNPSLALVASRLRNYRETTNLSFVVRDNIVGTPDIMAREMDGPQALNDTCAIKAQELIIERYTNREIAEDSLVDYATRRGWYTPGGGTPIDCVGNLIEESGIPVSRTHGASIFDLYEQLGEGKQVIIGVDGTELRGDDPIGEFFEEFYGGRKADHAVVVSGINSTTNQVFITDPATGLTQEYPFSRLTDAWSDSEFFMMSTNIPAPKWVPGMEDFDYALGHIATIQEVPFVSFQSACVSIAVPPGYTSSFGLADFLEIAPHSYGELLSEWSLTSDFSLPSDWDALCMSDQEWLVAVADSVGTTIDLSDLANESDFFEIAGEIFSALS